MYICIVLEITQGKSLLNLKNAGFDYGSHRIECSEHQGNIARRLYKINGLILYN